MDEIRSTDAGEILVWIALVISLVELYLKTNKIWKRKNERQVADSQSLAGLFLASSTIIMWVIFNISRQQYVNLVENIIYLGEALILILIGAGLWVKGQERVGIWTLIKKSLRLERREADYLIKKFFRPTNADTIIHILHQLAMIDDELEDKELELISSFAKEWNVEYSPEKLNSKRDSSQSNHFVELYKSLSDYLANHPQCEQVAQLRDMMTTLIHIDDKVTQEEDLIFSELLGMISNYVNIDTKQELYHVLIVPQKPEHELTIKNLLPGAVRMNVSGGVAYSIGAFYSYKYAEMICNDYRNINYFTIVFQPQTGSEYHFME